ncbi:hypothetical protein [Arthrobacter polaris]|uniref:hypothetical protein n=1 Tax=Arthrobacter polaris TaxID=2813727 RepID=UPI001F450E9A|nr:hypothetical protein [Arthrobacter polaris]UIK89875.1 hypothetical protein J0916_05900 [Arthrobacter polaris]
MMKTAGTMSQVLAGPSNADPIILDRSKLAGGKGQQEAPVITEDRTSSDNHDGMERNPDVSRVFEAG